MLSQPDLNTNPRRLTSNSTNDPRRPGQRPLSNHQYASVFRNVKWLSQTIITHRPHDSGYCGHTLYTRTVTVLSHVFQDDYFPFHFDLTYAPPISSVTGCFCDYRAPSLARNTNLFTHQETRVEKFHTSTS